MVNTKSLYSAHPGIALTRTWVAALKRKTGRSLEEWLALVKQSGPETENARRDWLKKEHGLGTNAAGWIAGRAEGKADEMESPEAYLAAAEKYVEGMLSGPKAGLRPVYDRLLQLGLGMGKDVKACPCKTMVPLYRNHVFAHIKPATRTRIDLGLALGAGAAEGRLIDTGGFAKKDRITHRIPIASLDQIDAEVKIWLQAAYNGDAAMR